jgi:prepilin-type N-terminal cleavage/methylation domain-containing protein
MSIQKFKNSYTSPDGRSGFTLIELLITITILAIFVAVSVTQSDLRTNRFTRQIAIDRITADIDLVRSMAFARHDTLTMVFSANNNSYSIFTGPDTDRSVMVEVPGSDNGIVSFSSGMLATIDITSATFNSSSELQFLPLGNVKSGGTILIDNSVTITVADHTGRWSVN